MKWESNKKGGWVKITRGRNLDKEDRRWFTNYAVESTARYAHDAGYDVYIPRDCCSSRNDEIHNFTLDEILPVLVTITTGPEIIEAFAN